MKSCFIILSLVFLSCLGCSSSTPEQKAARQFIDSYYVMANQKEAVTMTQGLAKMALEKELDLLDGVEARAESYKSRDIEFFLESEQSSGDKTRFLYKLVLHYPDVDKIEKKIMIQVDQKTEKVDHFQEL